MRRLMLLRHAKSAWPEGVGDHERPLAQRGRGAAPGIGRYMAEHELLPDLAIVSTARRAQETWELVAPALGRDSTRRDEPRIYEAGWEAILEVIRETKAGVRTLLVIGHNPGLQDLATALIGKGEKSELARIRQKFPTAGLAVIEFAFGGWSEVATGGGRLERFVTPKSASSWAPT
jgi:phosphohistidine phosphatase